MLYVFFFFGLFVLCAMDKNNKEYVLSVHKSVERSLKFQIKKMN